MKGHGPVLESIIYIILPIALSIFFIFSSAEIYKISSQITVEEEKIYDMKSAESALIISLDSYWDLNIDNTFSNLVIESDSKGDFSRDNIEDKINEKILESYDRFKAHFNDEYGTSIDRVDIELKDAEIESNIGTFQGNEDMSFEGISFDIVIDSNFSLTEKIKQNFTYTKEIITESEINLLIEEVDNIYDKIRDYKPPIAEISKKSDKIVNTLEESSEYVSVSVDEISTNYDISNNNVNVIYRIQN